MVKALFQICLPNALPTFEKMGVAVDQRLVGAAQDWDHDLWFERILPFPNKASAVITAIERNDLPMLQLLLDAGANVDGKCACGTGETPLWAATLFNRPDHVGLLLKRGADPNTPAATGTRPIHLAAMRGFDIIYEALVTAGADPSAPDRGPQFPRRGGVATPFIGGTGLERSTDVPSARSAFDWSSVRASSRRAVKKSETVIETGIKALDLFAPVPRGGLVRFPFKAGIGMMVLLGELIHRFTACSESVAIWSGFAQPPYDVEDWETEMAEFGLSGVVQRQFSSIRRPANERRATFEQGLRAAEAQRDRVRDVMLVIESTQGFETDIESSFLRLAEPHPCGSITTFVITPFTKQQLDEWPELRPPYDAQITLERGLARAFVFPAITPVQSFSNRLRPPHVSSAHAELAERSRQLVGQLFQLDPTLEHLRHDRHLSQDERIGKIARLLDYLRQPFFITSPWTGHPGVTVGRDEMLHDVAAIIR